MDVRVISPRRPGDRAPSGVDEHAAKRRPKSLPNMVRRRPLRVAGGDEVGARGRRAAAVGSCLVWSRLCAPANPLRPDWYHDHMFWHAAVAAAREGIWCRDRRHGDADWAPNFLHLRGLAEDGRFAAASAPRRVQRRLGRNAKQAATDAFRKGRPKKRKELRRIRNPPQPSWAP